MSFQRPPLGRMIALVTGYESEFTQAHSRIAAHAEEIAFLGGESCERKILDLKLNQLLNFRLVL